MEADKLKAENEKKKGNDEMKKENYSEAINHYTLSISLDENESTTYCNRSLAYMKMQQYDKAIGDCATAIELNKQYIKAYYRRGLCYGLIGKQELAIIDLLTAVTLSSSESKEIILEIKSQKETLLNLIPDKEQKAQKDSEIESNLVLALNKKYLPPNVQNQFNELIQLEDKEIQDIKSKIIQKEYLQAEAKIASAYKICKEFIQNIKNNYNCSEQHEYHIKITSAMNELKKLKEVLKMNKGSCSEKERFNKTILSSKQQRENATKIAEEGINFNDFTLTAYGFEKAFNSFKSRLSVFFDFMCNFKAENFVKAYSSTQISIPVLNGMIEAFIQQKDLFDNHKEMFIDYCIAITKTKSFSLVKDFMKKKDREFIKLSAETIQQSNKGKENQYQQIIQAYE